MITNDTNHTPIDTLTSIVRSAETVSLELLEAIDDTVTSLQGVAKVISGLEYLLTEAADKISAMPAKEGVYLDPDDRVINLLDQSIQSFNHELTRMVNKRSAINRDNRLQAHHSESLHDAYDEAMTATASLLEALHSARSAIIRNDLAAEPRTFPHPSADEVVSALRN